jgi:2-polyprenyl-3-methyl-5-hydroxy-6-metoxy-1,4-benzoquinol methylase
MMNCSVGTGLHEMTDHPSNMHAVHQREAAFFDEKALEILSRERAEQEQLLFVDADSALRDYPDHYRHAYEILGDLRGKRVLDMGCGSGKSCVILAKKGASVHAFDISPQSVRVARLRAEINSVGGQVQIEQMSAETMNYPSGHFDVAFGVGILHHVNIDMAAAEISRVLKERGEAVFIEPIAFSRLLSWLRNLKPVISMVPNKGKDVLITEDERQIVPKDLDSFRPHFSGIEYQSFQLFSRLDRLIGGYPVRRNHRLLSWINALDRLLLDSCPCLLPFGRWGVIHIRK